MADALREHRVGMLAWSLGGGAAMLFMGMALHQEMVDFPGGPNALAASVTPAAQAMRVLRWPADHLETLGGYLTFHNVMLISGLLAIYAALQGVRAVRGPEDRHALEDVLASGCSRTTFLRDRALAFVVVLVVICLGTALGTAWALAIGDQPDLGGSVVTMLAVGLGCGVAYSLGLLVAQLLPSARAAAGVTSLVLVVMYLANNALDEGSPLGWLRFATPFHWVNQSRALVPGQGLDVVAMLVLAAAALALAGAAAWAFNRRDYGTGLWSVRLHAGVRGDPDAGLRRWWLRAPSLAGLQEHRLGLLAWTLASAGFAALMIALQPAAMDVFAQFSYFLGMVGGEGGGAEAMYSTFATDVFAPVAAAYVVVSAAQWVAEQQQGRVEMLLAAPLSWPRLIAERMLQVGAAVLLITAASVITYAVGSAAIGADVSAAGLARVSVMCQLLAWAHAGTAIAVVTLTGSTIAVTLLGAYLGFAYLLTWLIPMFGWPAWSERLSIFAAFGHPYREWPPAGSIVLLIAVAVLGTALGVLLRRRAVSG